MFANVDPTLHGVRAEMNRMAESRGDETAQMARLQQAGPEAGSDARVLDLLQKAVPEIGRRQGTDGQAALRGTRSTFGRARRDGSGPARLERAEELFRQELGEQARDPGAVVYRAEVKGSGSSRIQKPKLEATLPLLERFSARLTR